MRSFIAAILIVAGFCVVAQTKYQVLGTVTDEQGEPVIGAGVLLEEIGIGTITDLKGKFILSAPKRNYSLIIQYLGMKEYRNSIYLNRDQNFNIEMISTSQELQAVVKTARADDYRITAIPGVEKLTFKDLENVPQLMGEMDVINSILLLPGVSSTGEGSSGFNVRGGKVDQNLITLNGGEIFNSSHLLGFFSIFNSDVVKEFTLYKGHIPANLGGRLSSALDIRTREGSYEDVKSSLTVGTVTSKFTFEAPIIKDKLSILTAGRFAYPNWLIKRVRDFDVKNSEAGFNDQNVIIGYRMNDRNRVNLSLYRSYDRFRFSDDFQFEWGHKNASLSVQNALKDNLFHEFEANLVDYENEQYDVPGDFAVQNGMNFLSIKDNWYYEGEKHAVNAGIEFKNYTQKPERLVSGSQSGFESLDVDKDEAYVLSGYINDDIKLGKLTLSAGLRYNFYAQTGRDQVYVYENEAPKRMTNIVDTINVASGNVSEYSNLEPRIGLNYLITKNISIKASYNQAYQYIHLISNTTSATPIDLWQVSTFHIEPQIASNYSFGVSFTGNKRKWQNSFDVFYRDIDNIYDYKDFASLLLNNHLETELINGKGRSYGFEVLLEKQKGAWTGWFAYTLSKTEYLIEGEFPEETINEGRWYPANYDQRHNLTISLSRNLGKKAFFAFNSVFNTGRPFTGVESSYNVNGAVVPLFSDRNKYRIPNYIRFDVSLGFKSVVKTVDDKLNFSIYNLFNRTNAYSVYYRKPSNVAIIPFSYQLSVLGRAFPSMTYTINF